MSGIAILSISSNRLVSFVHSTESFLSYKYWSYRGAKNHSFSWFAASQNILSWEVVLRYMKNLYFVWENLIPSSQCWKWLESILKILKKEVWIKCILILKFMEKTPSSRFFVEKMKMSIEAQTTLYVALSRVFINNWYKWSPVSKHIIENLEKRLPEDLKQHAEGLKIFKENGILDTLKKSGNALENQGKFYKNYMETLEVILLFIWVSREF